MKLKYPIDFDGERVEELEFARRPLARDSRDATRQARRAGDDSAAAHEIFLFANLCEVPPETIEAMDLADYGRLQAEYMDFLAG